MLTTIAQLQRFRLSTSSSSHLFFEEVTKSYQHWYIYRTMFEWKQMNRANQAGRMFFKNCGKHIILTCKFIFGQKYRCSISWMLLLQIQTCYNHNWQTKLHDVWKTGVLIQIMNDNCLHLVEYWRFNSLVIICIDIFKDKW